MTREIRPPVKTPTSRQILVLRGSQLPGQTNPQPPPPGSQEIKTVPPGSVPSNENGRDELMTLTKTVTFVTVPVTVKDDGGKLVEGLLASDFTIYEDGAQTEADLLHQRSVSFVGGPHRRPGPARIQSSQSQPTFSALGGAFGPFDEVSVFTYGNTVKKRQDFGNSTRMELALQRH